VSADQIVLLVVGLIVIAAVAVAVAWATAAGSRRDTAASEQEPPATGLRDHDDTTTDLPRVPAARAGRTVISPTSTRQVARVVALLYLASAAIIVAITSAWPDSEAAVFSLLAVGTLLVVLFMDLVPPAVLGRWRRPAEGIGAVIFLTLLTALTGTASSPFFVGFFLVVAGTALSTEGRAPLAIALLAATSVVLVGALDTLDGPISPEALAWVGFTAVALILLADIATAAARAQRHARDEALRASRFDSLTGLYNRAFFFTTMEQEIRRSDRMGRDFTMLMLDLDDLKPVNDTFGHQWGDRLLKAVADTIRNTIRFTDAAARYGGDEFVVLLPETDAAGGYVVAEKLRRDVASLTLRAAERNVRSSVSVGLVTYPHDGSTIEQLVAAADVAMYESKRRGKNRIVGYQTRTERVATAIDIESAAVITVEPMSDARTGGDPAPWGTAEPRAVRPSATRPTFTELGPAAQPGYAAKSTAAEPRSTAAESTSTAAEPRSNAAEPPMASEPPPSAEHPPAAEPKTPAVTAMETDVPRRPRQFEAPPAGQSDPGTRTGVSGTAPGSAPWLTRTGPTPADQPPATDQRPAADQRHSGEQRPAADQGPSGRSSGRIASRREEIRSDEGRGPRERPWIALPIEPWEPPERPKA
jgi:diguanylate cyclase (GGDEF)-like protein